jgi:beta-lactamase class A
MASTFKVPLSLSLLKQVDSGKLSLSEMVTLELKDVRPGTGVLATRLLSTGKSQHSVYDLLEMVVPFRSLPFSFTLPLPLFPLPLSLFTPF